MTEKKVVLTYDGLKNMEAELENLKTVRRKDVAEKIKEARGQGVLLSLRLQEQVLPSLLSYG